MFDKYTKITPGFVTQVFHKQGQKFVCVEQNFKAGDPVFAHKGLGVGDG